MIGLGIPVCKPGYYNVPPFEHGAVEATRHDLLVQVNVRTGQLDRLLAIVDLHPEARRWRFAADPRDVYELLARFGLIL